MWEFKYRNTGERERAAGVGKLIRDRLLGKLCLYAPGMDEVLLEPVLNDQVPRALRLKEHECTLVSGDYRPQSRSFVALYSIDGSSTHEHVLACFTLVRPARPRTGTARVKRRCTARMKLPPPPESWFWQSETPERLLARARAHVRGPSQRS